MAYYENVFIARPEITPQQVEELTANFTKVLADQGGKVTKTESWGLRQLAYKIKKSKRGHYVLLNIDAPPAAVIELERNLRINEDVLRYMTVKVDELEAGQSAMLRKDRDREYADRDDVVGRPARSSGGREDRGYRPQRLRAESETEGEA